MKNHTQKLATLGLLFTAALWGSTFFVIKDTVNTIHPLTLVAYRFGIAALIYALFILIRKGKFWVNAHHGIILGIFSWFVYFSQTLGLKYTTSSNSAFISSLFIIFVPIFGLLLFNAKFNRMQLIALAVALIGLWFLTGGLVKTNLGDIITLFTAIAMSLNILVIDKYVKEKKSILTLGFQQFLTTSVLSFIAAMFLHIPLSFPQSKEFLPLLYLVIFGNVIAQGLQLLCQKKLKVITATIIFTMEPVFGALFAWTLGKETFIPERAIGGIFIILALFISEVPLKSHLLKVINKFSQR